jgi:hypothetical protein
MVEPILVGRLLAGLELLVGLAIVGLAFQGYHRNQSRSMLFLGAGIATMTVVGTALQFVLSLVAAGPLVIVIPTGTDLLGMCLLLYAIVLARRE